MEDSLRKSAIKLMQVGEALGVRNRKSKRSCSWSVIKIPRSKLPEDPYMTSHFHILFAHGSRPGKRLDLCHWWHRRSRTPRCQSTLESGVSLIKLLSPVNHRVPKFSFTHILHSHSPSIYPSKTAIRAFALDRTTRTQLKSKNRTFHRSQNPVFAFTHISR